eukprot:TRINITY_DN4537_c0_g1_i1.p1 TRINITY_DN4537_c0_g1~~TRINITY_DN4537_c0_g1_i1.p1  ORF type:complete len:213 (+),score=20.97 TRINITY_DN4537_c0_g1_i1:212-850(+)
MASPFVPPVPQVETATVPPQSVTASSTVRALSTKLQDSFKSAVAQQRPWAELIDRQMISRPENVAEATSRIRRNLWYFRANYIVVISAVITLSVLWNPMALIWLALLFLVWAYVLVFRGDQPLVIGGRVLSETEKFWGLVAISVIVIFGFTSVGSILISGLVMGALAIAVHAAVRVPDDLFLDDQGSSGGLLSYLGFPSQSTTQLPTSIGNV